MVRVVTSGSAGSNHALITALYAKPVGLKAVLMLYKQMNSHSVRENLLMDFIIRTLPRHAFPPTRQDILAVFVKKPDHSDNHVGTSVGTPLHNEGLM